MPLKLKGIAKAVRKKKVEELLKKVGLHHVADHFPNELSGGQQQRVAIARAMIAGSPIIFADEPTGSLDVQTEQEILLLIQMLNQKDNLTFVIITHDEEVASIAHKTYRMTDGLLKGENEYAIS
jgi:acetoin utilization transport system ATP-binding protein